MITNLRINTSRFLISLFLLISQPLLADEVKQISWDDLLPPGWNPAKVFEEMSDEEFNALPNEKYAEMEAMVQAEINAAPVVETLNSQNVRIPGFIVPLEIDNTNIREFLLVPYFGACTHTPPPPPNQIIYSRMNVDYKPDSIFEPVWVTGKIKTGRTTSQLNESGVVNAANIDSVYSISVDSIEVYQ